MNSSRCITAFEHDVLTIGNGPGQLTGAEADRLQRAGAARPGLCEIGRGGLGLGSWTGVLGLGFRTLEILPKIGRHEPVTAPQGRGLLLRLLRHARRLPSFRAEDATQTVQVAPLLEVFVQAFLEAVRDVVRGGLMHRYRECEEDLGVVRGRILTQRQLTVLANRGDRVACRFDEHTADHVWNRVLAAALAAVRGSIQRPDLHRLAQGLTAAFDGVAARLPRGDLDRELVYDRHAERYRMAIGWARWILAVLSPALHGGGVDAPGLLFDMNRLFQEAVAGRLRSTLQTGDLPLTCGVRAGYLAELDTAKRQPRVRLQPDLVLSDGGQAFAVGDTKWKCLKVNGGHLAPEESDIYQLLAYAAALRCEHLSLIFPWHEGLKGALQTTLRLPALGGLQPRLTILCVDLRAEPWTVPLGDISSPFTMQLLRRR